MQTETAQRSEIPGETEGQIIARHDQLIRHVAIPFADRGVELDDLIQDGRLALIVASRTWLPSGGAALWTYAYKSVYAAISRRKTKEIEEPCHTQPLLGHFDHACSNGGNSDGGEDVTGGVDNIGDDAPSAEERLELAELVAISSRELIGLSEVERRVLRLRFVDELDVRSIGDELGLPRSTAHDTLSGAIEKLRELVGARL